MTRTGLLQEGDELIDPNGKRWVVRSRRGNAKATYSVKISAYPDDVTVAMRGRFFGKQVWLTTADYQLKHGWTHAKDRHLGITPEEFLKLKEIWNALHS